MTKPNVGKPAKLVGHYNPAFEYPQQVAPLLRSDSGLFVAYANGSILHEVSPELAGVELHDDELCQRLQDYDPVDQGLFASAHDQVEAFSRDHAAWFFERKLRTGELDGANPFFKISLLETLHRDDRAFWTTLRACILELGGRGSGFAQHWYEKYRLDKPFQLPSTAFELLGESPILEVACLPADESLLRAVSRLANDSGVFIAPVVKPWLSGSSDEFHARLAESEADEPEPGAIAVGAAELVLVVSAEFKARHKLAASWSSVFEAATRDPDFRWTRPRSETASGQLVDLAISEVIESTEAWEQLESRATYSRFDHDAAGPASRGDALSVHAIVMKRHAVARLLRHLDEDQRPRVIPYDSPLLIPYELRPSREGQPLPHSLRSFFARSQLTNALARVGVATNAMQQVAALAARASNVVAPRGRPIAVYLVADVSGSMRGRKLEAAKQGLKAFLALLSAGRVDALGLVAFEDEAKELVAMGAVADVGAQVDAAIDELVARGKTALIDAVAKASKNLQSWRSHRRAIVVLSDGIENNSKRSLDELLLELGRDADGPMILGLAYGADADAASLQRLADATRGKVLNGTAPNIGELFRYVGEML